MTILNKHMRKNKISLMVALAVSVLAVLSLSVSTFAWFQANANAEIHTDSATANITVAAPEGAKFYYFTGNGTPGSDYTGYSADDSRIGKAPRTIPHSSDPLNVQFTQAAGKYYFQEITGAGIYTAANCFNFQKIRPGVHYSFCISYASSSCNVKLTFSNGTTGNNTTPKRKIGTSAAPGSAYNVSLGLAINSYCSGASTTGNAAAYIKSSLDASFMKSTSGDRIDYPTSDMADDTSFSLLANNADTTTNKYIYFTVYMGFNDKGDALLYNSKSGTGASEVIYYTRDSASGNYSALDGLTMSLSKVELTLS